MPKQNNERVHTSPISEFYNDLLRVDAWLSNKPRSTQAASLLCAKLNEKEQRIRERIAYLAKKRGISADELWSQILEDKAESTNEQE